jgi:hypothetical protein
MKVVLEKLKEHYKEVNKQGIGRPELAIGQFMTEFLANLVVDWKVVFDKNLLTKPYKK